jgi:hypothetical protein
VAVVLVELQVNHQLLELQELQVKEIMAETEVLLLVLAKKLVAVAEVQELLV